MINTSTYNDNNTIRLFTLENDELRVVISEYGAMIKSIVFKSLNRETVCGLDSYADDLCQTAYLGSIIGRCGNRIAKGKFTLNDTDYQVPINNGENHLHGGIKGFDKQLFKPTIDNDTLVLTYTSIDGEEAYPGNCTLTLRYHLEESSLVLETSGVSDKDTLFDPTQHTYFNLNEDKSSIGNHTLLLNSEEMYCINESGVTYNKVLHTLNTLYDFSHPKQISECLNQSHIQLERNLGIDNFFIKKDKSNPFIAALSVSDLNLTIYTTHCGAHVYSGNYLNTLSNGSNYPFLKKNGGICFETQHVPNSINFDLELAPILKAHKTVTSRTIYHYKKGE
jgi:aldose 1-epimerase